MIRLGRIRASALQFAILISAIIALLLGAFLLLTHTHRFFKDQSNATEQLILETREELIKILESNGDSSYDALEEQNGTQISTNKGFWGGFELYTSNSSRSNKNHLKKAIIGASFDSNTSVVVGDVELPLVLVGNSRLGGDAYVSPLGIKAGVVGGKYFRGKSLCEGQIIENTGGLPELSKGFKQYLNGLVKYVSESSELDQKEGISFYKDSGHRFSRDTLFLTEKLVGNIVIQSEAKIVVTPEAQLEDVILVAPEILIEADFNGALHAIATRSIEVEKEVSLSYPSSLVMLDQEGREKNKEAGIIIGENVEVSGNILYLRDEGFVEDLNSRSEVAILALESSLIAGMVYCEGNLELRGTVSGQVYTHRFIVTQFGSRYLNHLFDGKILPKELELEFAGLPLEDSEKAVGKWLY